MDTVTFVSKTLTKGQWPLDDLRPWGGQTFPGVAQLQVQVLFTPIPYWYRRNATLTPLKTAFLKNFFQ